LFLEDEEKGDDEPEEGKEYKDIIFLLIIVGLE
jgi:hypothetical protein